MDPDEFLSEKSIPPYCGVHMYYFFDRENFSWSIESENWGKPECENLLYLLDMSSKVYKCKKYIKVFKYIKVLKYIKVFK